MPNNKLTQLLFDRLKTTHPVTVNGKVPTLDDARAIIKVEMSHADDDWKVSAPKKVVSRSVCQKGYL